MTYIPSRQANGPRFADPALDTASHTAEAFQDKLSAAESVLCKINRIVDAARARDDDGIELFDVLNASALLMALDDAHMMANRMRDRHAP